MPSFREKAEFFDVLVVDETTLAIKCVIDGTGWWIPQSCIDSESDVRTIGDEGTLVISEWIAKEKGLV